MTVVFVLSKNGQKHILFQKSNSVALLKGITSLWSVNPRGGLLPKLRKAPPPRAVAIFCVFRLCL